MILLVKFLVVGALGGLSGLLLTYLTIEQGPGLGAVAAGPWTGRPQSGTAEIDPYARARLARTGELPLGVAEGLGFVAREDSSGTPLDPACDYAVTGNIPRARYWTLTLQSPKGLLVANAAERYGFTSSEILRSADGTFEILVSRRARPGNWLPIGSDAPFILVLRLYDTEIDRRAAPLDAAQLPQVVERHCR